MITILATGKVRERYIKEGMEEYLMRLQKYAKVTYVEKDNLNVPEGYVIALDEKGKQYTSEQFAGYLKKKTLEQKNITFIIGGAEGIPAEIKAKCNEMIALSAMTFPNQLVWVIFVEQLYRAFTIIKEEKYHK
jgi:23S rRNA (pseudouridine1915-N3)-methyltransferase